MKPRDKVLDKAKEYINGDRNEAYGECAENFQDIADIVNVLFRRILKDNAKVTPLHVGEFMMAVKLARLMKLPDKFQEGNDDTFIDLAGYAATTFEAYMKTKR